MPDTRTIPHRPEGLPVRSLEVKVVDGPDRGTAKSAPADTLSVGTAPNNDLVLGDPTVSRYHLELVASGDEILVVDLKSTNGIRIGSTRLERGAIAAGTHLKIGKTTLQVDEGKGGSVDLLGGETLGRLRGSSAAMRRVMALVDRASQSNASVVVVGESGTGKEVVARSIHEQGPRAAHPFVTVDCGALSPALIASELFGHEKGAFTGADSQHAGAFERAAKGTLFLDEVGELPLSLQPALLGVLERKQFRRVGGKTDLGCDVRVLAATNRDLRAEVNSGRFRLDLYFRLAVLRVELPPLRDHPDDIELLIRHFLAGLPEVANAAALFPRPTLESLRDHRWPGNVRELRNFVEATVALGETARLEPPAPGSGQLIDAAGFTQLRDQQYRPARQQLLDEFERRYLERLLERSGSNVSQAARLADMDRSHLVDLLRRHQLK